MSFSLLLSGCQIGEKQLIIKKELGSNNVMCINDMEINIGEANLLMVTYLNSYKEQYGDELLTNIKNEYSLYDYVKDVSLKHLAQIVCMSELADSENITLTDEEEAKVEKAVTQFMGDLSKKDMEAIEVTKKEVKDLYQRYALSEKTFKYLTEGSDREVSDEDARVMEIHQIYVTTTERSTEIENKLAEGKDFEDLIVSYNEADSSDRFIGRQDIDERLVDAVFSLKDGEIAQGLPTGDGYYFIKCVNYYNEIKTVENKSIIKSSRAKEAYENTYNSYIESICKEYNKELWDEVDVSDYKDTSTNNFFKIYDEIWKK